MPLRYNEALKATMLNDILGLLDDFAKMSNAHSQNIAHATGLSELEVMILREIQMSGTLTPTMIIKNLNLSQYRIKVALDSLMEKQLIVKVRDNSDKRAWAIGLSDDGDKILVSSSSIRNELVERFAYLPIWKQMQILGSLHQVSEIMKL